jgi:preprotein translocase subunit SecA
VQDSSTHALAALADQGVAVNSLSDAGPAALPSNGARTRQAQGQSVPSPEAETLAPVVKSAQDKIGRNDPCWCGSGKKYKLCHGAA